MVKLNITKNFLVITLHQEFIVFSLNSVQNTWDFLKVIKCQENFKNLNDSPIECCAFSPCGKYFGVCCDRNIIIYDTYTWCLYISSLSERKACSLQFFPSSEIILLADKSGYVSFYFFTGKELKKNDRNLGHNSMLISALVTKDEKYIITCDRDEKIRVSNYPNVYNIENYCLGHKMFVSCIEFLQTDNSVLISSSGDGTIRLWDFITGKQLALYNCGGDTDLNKNSQPIILKFVSCKSKNNTILAVLEYKSEHLRILEIEGGSSKNYTISLIDILQLATTPMDIIFQGETLVCLLPSKENPFAFWSVQDESSKKTAAAFKNSVKYLTENWDAFVQMSNKISDNVPILFKREVDNLQEYEQRKKARLIKTGKTS